MEQEKVEKFYYILLQYKGQISQPTYQNETYREAKIYNFWIEFGERLAMFWMMIQKIYYFCCPLRTLEITFDRLISCFAFCPPLNTYVFNFEQSCEDKKTLTGEILLSHFVNNTSQKLIDIYQNKFVILAKYLECFFTFTEFGNRIACIFIRASLDNDEHCRTIVYSHTNAEDIGTILCHLWKMKRRIGCNIFAYDYSGFGMSSGLPSERNIYADVTAAVNELMKRKRLEPSDLILFGESIGSVPTIYIATQIKAYGVVLQSSFMSGIRIYYPYNGKTLPFDPFPNIERVSMIQSPTLMIHGTEDTLVDINHAVAIYNNLKHPVFPFWANGASHMNIHKHPFYYERISYFIEFELQDQ